jgi:nitroimidazol reductase NimA-like FMN-containing flavoprotein (pyridoxamine 5'-phosphate oxidase superfamily)
MTDYPITPRTRLRRLRERGVFDRDAVHAIIDQAYVCHVGARMADRPMVQPTIHWRDGETLYIHGSSKNGLFAALQNGEEACVTITHFDGLVLARSAFHHSVNYRCAMIFGTARTVTDEAEKMAALESLIERVAPGRWTEVRPPNAQELKATTVLAFAIDEVSAKVRAGPPVDDAEDYALPVWAGVVPFELRAGEPIVDPGQSQRTATTRYST